MHTSQSHIGNGLSWGDLLAPIRPDVFVTDYLQKKPLHISGRNTRCYSDAVTLETFHEIVTSGTLQHPALRLVRDGVEIRPHEFITEGIGAGGSASRPVDVGRVLVLYRTGATIVMPGMERYWPPLAHLCRSVERASSCGVQANAYLTPPAA